MVATISVLGGGAVGIAQYFTATTGYYDVEQSGVWHGAASHRLRLSGKVDREDLERLLAGQSPNGRQLAKKPRHAKATDRGSKQDPKSDTPSKRHQPRGRAERVPGYDICFSAPKSVSAAWAIGSPQLKTDIETCMRRAVRQTLDDTEKTLPLGRRGRNGTEHIAAELTAAMFLHTTSRDDDPQLHIHSVIANLCYGEDGRWSSVNSRMLHQWTPALGRVFRCHLANELVKELGVELERPQRPDGSPEAWFEIKGVPEEIIKEFSQRRQAIEKTTPKDQLDDSHARSKANLETRRKKSPDQDRSALQQQWNQRAARLDFTRQHTADLCNHSVKRQDLSNYQLFRAIEHSIDDLGRENAHFREWEVVAQVCERLQHRAVDPSTMLPRLFSYLQQTRSVVTLDNQRAQQQFSTRDNWNLEKKLLRDVDQLGTTRGAKVDRRTIEKTCNRFEKDESKPFSAEQRAAVVDLLTDEKSIRVLTGVAGAGKSVALEAVRQGFEKRGYQVIGGALAGTAAAGLNEKTKTPSRTVASYLHHLDRTVAGRLADRVRFDTRMMIRALRGKSTYQYQPVRIPRKGVLIVDEAGMLDTRSMSRLVHHVKKANATLILVGDSQQLPPIEAGGPLERICQKLGYAKLTTNHRQQNEADALAVALLRAGKPAEALDNYTRRGRLAVTKDHAETLDRIVETWKDHGGTKQPGAHVILTQTRADAHELNRRCQQERLASKLIPGLGVRHGESTYYSGDRVMFHLPMRSLGIENGFTATVTKVDPLRQRITVKLDREPSRPKRGRDAKPSHGKLVTISLLHADEAAVSLGYAATTHKLQGATVDHALVLLGGKMLSKQLAYTQLTRGSKSTHLFASREQAGENLELLVKGMSRSSVKNLAHDVRSLRTREQQQSPKPSLDLS